MQDEAKDARSTSSFCCEKILPMYTKLVPHPPKRPLSLQNTENDSLSHKNLLCNE